MQIIPLEIIPDKSLEIILDRRFVNLKANLFLSFLDEDKSINSNDSSDHFSSKMKFLQNYDIIVNGSNLCVILKSSKRNLLISKQGAEKIPNFKIEKVKFL